jgi:ribosomal protein S24E
MPELKTDLKTTKTNPLIGRKEIEFEIKEQATPSRAEVRRDIAVIMKTDLDKVWVRQIETKTGTHTTVGLVHVYDDSAKALQVEPEHIIKRNQAPAPAEKEEEPPAVETAPEEEKSEEESPVEEAAPEEEEKAEDEAPAE